MLIRRLLFYYSVLISAVLLVWIIVYLPRPQSLVPLIVFLPIPIYFFLRITGLHKTQPGEFHQTTKEAGVKKGLDRLGFVVIATLTISSISIFIYSLMYENYSPILKNISNTNIQVPDNEDRFKEILDKLSKLEAVNSDIQIKLEELASEPERSSNSTRSSLGASSVELNLADSDIIASKSSFLRITSDQKVNVYDDNSSSSKIVGQAEYNKIYIYTQKLEEWYQITLPDGKQGWIRKQFASEIEE